MDRVKGWPCRFVRLQSRVGAHGRLQAGKTVALPQHIQLAQHLTHHSRTADDQR